MASSNKVVLVKRGSFGVGHSALEVFDNRKQLTSWLPNNICLADPDDKNDDDDKETVFEDDGVLRDAVDVSFSEGMPLKYNKNHIVAKWLSGSIDDPAVLVRVALEYDILTGIAFGPFVPSETTLKTSNVLDIFKLTEKNLPRVRVVSSIEPFCEGSKAGFQVGDILLRHRQQRKTELFLESDKKPLRSELETNGTKSVLFVARLIPTPIAFAKVAADPSHAIVSAESSNLTVPTDRSDGLWSLVRATDIVLPSDEESKEASDDDESKEASDDEDVMEETTSDVKVLTQKKPNADELSEESDDEDLPEEPSSDSKTFIKKDPSPKVFLGHQPSAAFDRHGWASRTKAPPNHIFATEEKVLSYQIPLGTRAANSKARKGRSQVHSSKKAQKPVTGSVHGNDGENNLGLANLSLADAKKPTSQKSKTKVSHSAKRIAELEAKVARLEKALAEMTSHTKKKSK